MGQQWHIMEESGEIRTFYDNEALFATSDKISKCHQKKFSMLELISSQLYFWILVLLVSGKKFKYDNCHLFEKMMLQNYK